MSNTPQKLTRNQLAEFLPNARAVRAFEQMLKQTGQLLPDDITVIYKTLEELSIESASGNARAQQSLDLLASIADSLSVLALAPKRQNDNSIKTDYLDFSTSAPVAFGIGRLWWDASGTLNIGMGSGNITQQVGEEFFVYGKATAAITEGQLIMVTGSVGASGVVTFAPTSVGLLDPNAVLGIATENIALNGFGRVTTMGIVHGINTTGSSVGEVWADGDVLWYNPSFVGSMTKTKPSAPNMKTQVAIVINAGSGWSGSLQVEVSHGSILGGTDSNVQLGALSNNQLLQYDSGLGYWKNVDASAVTEPPITSGTTAQYWRGDKTWRDFATDVRATVLTGLSTATNAIITAADTVLSALGKLQKQISDNLTTLTSHTSASSGVHGVTGNLVGTSDSQTLTNKTLTSPVVNGGTINNTPIGGTTPASGAFTSVTSTTGVSVIGAAGLGYGVGSGGSVTQATSKTTAVTLNKPTGKITMNGAALGAGVGVSFAFNNSLIGANDCIVWNISGTVVAGNYNVWSDVGGAGGVCTVTLKNISGGSLSEAVVLNFVIIKGSIT